MNENIISVKRRESESSRGVSMTSHRHTDGISAVETFIMLNLSWQHVNMKEKKKNRKASNCNKIKST